MEKIKIALTGGGTAGHIWPTLAVADEIKKINPDADFIYIGSKNGIESKIIPGTNYKFFGISAEKMRRYFSVQNLTAPFKVGSGFFQSLKILKKEKPDVIFAKGGYVTVPVVIAGWFLKIPSIIHESDSVLGLANKILSRYAKKIATSFPKQYYPSRIQSKIIYSGSPIRKEFLIVEKNKGYQIFGLTAETPILLVFGGSQGAHKINELILKNLKPFLEKCQIIHITGDLDYKNVMTRKNNLPANLQDHYKVFNFLTSDMPYALQIADLVVSRSGANALAELSALGKASILIPLSTSASNHQYKNAMIFKENRAALILDENNLKPSLLLRKITDLITRPFLLKELGNNIHKLYKDDSAKIIASHVLDLKK